MGTLNIVTVNVSVTSAPIPNNLQQQGAFVTQGGTTGVAQTLTQVPTLASLAALLAPAKALTSLAWASGSVTATTTAPHGWGNGDVVQITIAGATPAAYNGTFAATITGASTFTYPIVSNPGSETVPGTANLLAVAELLSMGTTYFAGNGVVAPYVLELGEGIPSAGVAALQTFITNNSAPQLIYSYLIPREWDNVASFLTFLATFVAPNKTTYFYVTTKNSNITGSPAISPYNTLKCVLAEVEAPAVPTTEFSLASAFGTTLSVSPNSTNRVGPLSYAPAFGVTPYPLPGNQTVFANLISANVGWIGTGQQGGIVGNILFQGQMQDANPWNFWYSADWAQINIAQALANEVINGSVPGANPLYYNQNGIDRLQSRAVQTLNQAITNGLALGTVLVTKLPAQTFANNYNSGAYNGYLVINAEPFTVYTAENPSDYAVGKYAGLQCVYTPSRGFLNIFFNLNVTNIVAVA